MKQDHYLSGVSVSETHRFRVFGRTVEETAQLGRLLGFKPETILVAIWINQYEYGMTVTYVTNDVFQLHPQRD